MSDPTDEPTDESPGGPTGDVIGVPTDHPAGGPAGDGSGSADPFALRCRGRPLPSRAGGWGGASPRPGAAPGTSRPGPGERARSRLSRAGTPGRRGRDGGGDGPAGRGAGAAGPSARAPYAAPPGSEAAATGSRGGGRRGRGASLGGAVPGGLALRAAGRGVRATASAGPLALFLLLALVVFVVAPTTGALSGGAPQVEPGGAATAEIPRGYLEAYMAAEDEHGVPWPVLAAMGHVLTEHGARSPYDTVRRTDEQRYPVVEPPIAPGAGDPGGPAAGCRARFVGDSILVGMQAALGERPGGCELAGLEARTGRTVGEAVDVLTAESLGEATALVVALGTNDLAAGATPTTLERRVADLVTAAGGRPVIWQNVAAGGAVDPGPLDEALAAVRERFPNLVVADWAAHLAAQPEPEALRAADGVHYTPAGYEVMAGWLARQVAAPRPRAVDPVVGDGGLGPLLLNPVVFPGLSVESAQSVAGSVDALARAMAEQAERTDTPGADDARTAGFTEDALSESEALWHAVAAAAPVVAGDSACLQPDASVPIPQVVEVVWRCEMLRTPPVVFTPAGAVDGVEAQNVLLDEAHAVAAAWSSYGAAACDAAAPYAGVFPVPVTATDRRCDPVENVRAAARLVLDQESRPLDERPGATEWEQAAAGWATMPPALGDAGANRFTAEGPPAGGFEPGDGCRRAVDTALDAAAATTPAYATFSALALFEPRAVDFDPTHWDRVFDTTTVAPLLAPGGACDPGADRAAALGWLAGELAGRQVEGNPAPGLAGAVDYATWVSTSGELPRVGETGLVPRLHNPRLAPPSVTRPQVTGGAVAVNPAEFAARVIAKARVYAGHATAVPVEVMGWESLAALGIPEHAARAYVQALGRIGELEPGCGIDLAYLAAFGYMESGHGTVAVAATGEADGASPRAPVVWDPLTGESQPRILGALLDGRGAGGNTTPHRNDLSPRDRSFYRQDDPYLRAVGPTQFLPAAWETVRAVADGNDDGVADPFNYYDGALATAVKSCRDGGGLATEADSRRATLAYNDAGWYADGVMGKAAEYRAGLAAMGQAGAGGAAAVVVADGPVTIVDVYGVRVNAAIADRFRALVDAAGADGLDLAEGSGGWRSPERQIELRRAHCGTSDYAVYQMPASRCSPPTARPGTSEHERGLAIDFRCNGEPIGQQDRSNPCVVWLTANAARYGLHNLPSEAWHWSTSGG